MRMSWIPPNADVRGRRGGPSRPSSTCIDLVGIRKRRRFMPPPCFVTELRFTSAPYAPRQGTAADHVRATVASKRLPTVLSRGCSAHTGLVLSVEDETGERLIAVARFVRVACRKDRAEFAITVADDYQNRGAPCSCSNLWVLRVATVSESSSRRSPKTIVRCSNSFEDPNFRAAKHP